VAWCSGWGVWSGRGPGLVLLIPFVERMVRVDTRVITIDVPAQEVITLDNVTIKVNAVLYFMVVNPDWAIIKVMDYIRATLQIAQTTLRSGVGQVDLDTLLARREQLNARLQTIIDEQTEPMYIHNNTCWSHRTSIKYQSVI